MPTMNYQYDPSEKASRNGGNSRIRFYLLLTGITALMAGAVFWLFFSGEKKKTDQPEKPAVQKETEEKKPKKTEQQKPEQKKPAEQSPQKKQESVPVITEKVTPVMPAAGDEKLPEAGKGVVLPSDSPVEKDKAQPTAQLPVDESAQAALKEAQTLLNNKKYQESAALIERTLPLAQENSPFYRELWKTLTAARLQLIAKGDSAAGTVLHRIRSGESLSRIADKNETTVELLKKINRTGNRIFVGRTLKVLPGPWKIKVEKSARLLKLYRAEKLYLVFDAGIGRMGKTPTAEFAVCHRLYHPDWYTGDGKIYKYGEPENQLGECFLKLALFSSPGKSLSGFGIHGCKDESTVGRSLSNGCVRLRNAEITWLYYLVPVGSRVEIAE